MASFKDTLLLKSTDFNSAALELFQYQAEHCAPYKRFLEGLSIDVRSISSWEDIPHLPIEAFKNHEVKSGDFDAEVTYTSSGTTGQNTSRHYVREKSWYHRVFEAAFRDKYGDPSEFQWLCLLPSYLERKGSSLIDMADAFIQSSKFDGSGFYLSNLDDLKTQLEKSVKDEIPTVLLGVSFALLDLAEEHPMSLSNSIVIMETGGMKGRRKELIRDELHAILKEAFHVEMIHSEYGMTELMSQAYSSGNGRYTTPPWMRITLRDPADPLSKVRDGKTGGINIIDLANVDSCAFIATQDLGRIYPDATFEVLGRFDQSDIRGCNLLVL
ncbi:acyl transferase [Phaeocystidibacter luteus]|uniref:Acyl transferase n=1 Tax=Phaeocystidibacter luteus TaxID=911197 RepID=A0A6N6RFF6_9FLAO|nr:acyl transferase [Phaeocystidibacter luteus]